VRAGELGGEGDREGRGSALPDMVPSCSTQPEKQSRDGDGDWHLALPSNACLQLHAAGGNMTVSPVPGGLAALRALAPPGLDLHQLCRLSTCQQDPALPRAQKKGIMFMLFCHRAAVSGSSIYANYNTLTAALLLGI